jgi:hypothetical protein
MLDIGFMKYNADEFGKKFFSSFEAAKEAMKGSDLE